MRLKRFVWLSIVFTLLLGAAAFRVTVSTTSGSIVWSDGLAYFMYARSIALDHDTDLTNEYQELSQRFPWDPNGPMTIMSSLWNWAQKDPVTGRISLPWPPGAGIVMLPFYMAGFGLESLVAQVKNRPVDSYGLIPQLGYCFGSLVYGLIGFWATFVCCRYVASEKVALLSAALVVLAGPLVFYIFFNPSMSHAAAFCFTALLVMLWLRCWNEGVTLRTSWLLGLNLGILILIRYQNVLFGILLAALYTRELWRAPNKNLACAAVAILSCAIPFSVMLLHSHFFGISASRPPFLQNGVIALGQFRIDLSSPFFTQVLTSCKQGAFYWSPALAICFVGLLWAAVKTSSGRIMLLIFLANVYLIGGVTTEIAATPLITTATTSERSSTIKQATLLVTSDWNQQWNGGKMFGMRYLAECGTFLAVGLAMLVTSLGSTISAQVWWGFTGIFSVLNALLILAYGLGTVSKSSCVTHEQMATGIMRAIARLFQ